MCTRRPSAVKRASLIDGSKKAQWRCIILGGPEGLEGVQRGSRGGLGGPEGPGEGFKVGSPASFVFP
jgi:hypothetical protein